MKKNQPPSAREIKRYKAELMDDVPKKYIEIAGKYGVKTVLNPVWREWSKRYTVT